MSATNKTIPLTPSQQKRLDQKKSNADLKVLDVYSAPAGIWIVVEKLTVRKTKKHRPPFRYYQELYGKRGGLLLRQAGNVWDGELLIDNFTQTSQGHTYGYRRG